MHGLELDLDFENVYIINYMACLLFVFCFSNETTIKTIVSVKNCLCYDSF